MLALRTLLILAKKMERELSSSWLLPSLVTEQLVNTAGTRTIFLLQVVLVLQLAPRQKLMDGSHLHHPVFAPSKYNFAPGG